MTERDTMDFFGAQDTHRRNTVILLVYFAIAVTVTATAAYGVTLVYWFVLNRIANFWRSHYDLPTVAFEWWNVYKYALIAGPSAIILIGLSIWKTKQLAAPIDIVMPLIGATEVDRTIRHPATKRYIDVVEEMSIASQTKMPRTFVISRQYGINAMAVGWTSDEAAIAVSAGAIQMLDRNEMQGVIGHEFSHILNGDMAMNVRLLGVLYGIDCIGVAGKLFVRTLIRSGQLGIPGHSNILAMGSWVALFLSLPFALLSWVGLLFGQAIRAAISRQREYLADASSVQFTRLSDGIAGALKKIGGLTAGSSIQGANLITSHFFLASALESSSNFLSASSHPPLEDRVKRVEPHFDGVFPYLPMHYKSEMGKPENASWQAGSQSSGSEASDESVTTPSGSQLTDQDIATSLTKPNADYSNFSRQLFAGAPAPLLKAAGVPEEALLVTYAVLLSAETKTKETEIQRIKDINSVEEAEKCRSLAEEYSECNTELEVPLLEKALASMKELSRPECEEARDAIRKIFPLDQVTDSHSYLFRAAVTSRIDSLAGKRSRSGIASKNTRGLDDQLTVLAAYLLKWKKLTADSEDDMRKLAIPIMAGFDYDKISTEPKDLEEAFSKVSAVNPATKRDILVQLFKLLAPDACINAADSEILWLVAELMRCRIPPVIPGELKKKLKR